jgi:hypothetical protein
MLLTLLNELLGSIEAVKLKSALEKVGDLGERYSS